MNKEKIVLLFVCFGLIGIGLISKLYKSTRSNYSSEATCKIHLINDKNTSISYYNGHEYVTATIPTPYHTLYSGEEYKVLYGNAISDVNVLYDSPIFSKLIYKHLNSINYKNILFTYENRIEIHYEINNKIFMRILTVDHALKYPNVGKCNIFYNPQRPEISYFDRFNN